MFTGGTIWVLTHLAPGFATDLFFSHRRTPCGRCEELPAFGCAAFRGSAEHGGVGEVGISAPAAGEAVLHGGRWVSP